MSWYAFEVETTREQLVTRLIRERLGFQAFTPLVGKLVKRGIQRRQVLEHFPAFPRYVFASFSEFHPWDAIKRVETVRHVYGVMGIDDIPIEIPHSQMEHVLKLDGTVMEQLATRSLKPGDSATIRQERHAFDGHVVNVVKVNGKYAEVAAKLFGTVTPLRVPVSMLEAA